MAQLTLITSFFIPCCVLDRTKIERKSILPSRTYDYSWLMRSDSYMRYGSAQGGINGWGPDGAQHYKCKKLYYCILLSLADVTDAGATRALDAATPGARDADGQGQGPGLSRQCTPPPPQLRARTEHAFTIFQDGRRCPAHPCRERRKRPPPRNGDFSAWHQVRPVEQHIVHLNGFLILCRHP